MPEVTGFKTPQFSPHISWNQLPATGFSPNTTYDDLLIENKNCSETSADAVHINCGWFKKINLTKSKFNKLNLIDVKITESNLSNLIATDSLFLRMEFMGCKITGFQFLHPTMENILLESCNSQYLQLRFGTCHHVIFKNCDLKGSDFTGTNLAECEFINCDLSESDFSGAKLLGTDLRGSNLEKIHIGIPEIKGAIVNTPQALYLTGILGIDIRD